MKYKYGVDQNNNEIVINQPDGLKIEIIGVEFSEVPKEEAKEKVEKVKMERKVKEKIEIDKKLDKGL